MNRLFFFVVLCVLVRPSFGQNRTQFTISKAGTFDPRVPGENWSIHIQNQEAPSPGGDGYRDELLRRKMIMNKRFPRSGNASANFRSNDTLPIINHAFEGNQAQGSTPNDNTLAISDSGLMVSSINVNTLFYDTNADTVMAELGLWEIAQPLNIMGSKYDPKVIYDPEADRFILVFLNGTSALSSTIIMAFSSTNNPMDTWNLYEVEGNPLNDTSWSDYPAISINEHDLFLTINLLISGPGVTWQNAFKQTLIWQFDKWDGYNGEDSLRTVMWDDIAFGGTNIRNMHPVRVGRGVLEDDMYALSNRNFAMESDSIFVMHITGRAADATGNLTVDMIRADNNYYLTVDGIQPDSQFLATNDNRVLGAIKEGDIIHFVQNSSDTASGNAAIYHGRLDLANMRVTAEHIALPDRDLGYPNIAYTGIDFGEDQGVISFSYSGYNHHPGVAAIYYSDTGYSDIRILRTGDSTINMLTTSDLERWGDYSGVQRKYNEPCRIWGSTTFGKSDRRNGTWIFELAAEDSCRTLPIPPIPDTTNYEGEYTGTVFPNPVPDDVFSFAFTMDADRDCDIILYDSKGSLVKLLYRDIIKAGKNLMTFTTEELRPGLYILTIQSEGERMITTKIVVK